MALARPIARALPRGVRNWLRSPAKTMRWAWDDLRYRVGVRDWIAIRPGWEVLSHPAARRCAYWAQMTDPSQVEELDAFIAACLPGMRLIDVGAHFGVFSLAALHYGGGEARGIAVEPSPSACRILRIQAALNVAGRRLEIVQAVASDHEGWEPMIALGPAAAGYFAPPGPRAGPRDRTLSRAVTVDQLVAETGLNPTHLKIDVEGAEAAVLRGARGILTGKHPPLLFVELHNQMVRRGGGDPAQTLAVLREYGYHCFARDNQALDNQAVLGFDLVRLRARRG